MKKLLAALICVPLILLITKCTAVHFEHDAAARRLLVTLGHFPLPDASRLLLERSAVGGSFSGTGDATNIAAIKVFTTDLPAQNVIAFFAPYFHQASSQADVGVFPLAQPPQSPQLPFDEQLKTIPQAERSRTFVLYVMTGCEDDGIWDIRGW